MVKRKMVAVSLVTVLLAGCGATAREPKANPVVPQELIEAPNAEEALQKFAESKENEVKEQEKVEEVEAQEEPEIRSEDERVEEAEEVDPLEMLLLDDYAIEEAKTSVGKAALKKDDKFYTLNSLAVGDMAIPYGVGYRAGREGNTDHYATICTAGADIGSGAIITIGDVVTPVLSRTNHEYDFVGFGEDYCEIYEMEFLGYGLPVMEGSGPMKFLLKPGGYYNEIIDLSRVNNFQVCDEKGEDFSESYYNLDGGAEYMVSWFEGTQYNEWKMVADSKWFVRKNGVSGYYTKDAAYVPEGEFTKEGYVLYDYEDIMAHLAPGYYIARIGTGFRSLPFQVVE